MLCEVWGWARGVSGSEGYGIVSLMDSFGGKRITDGPDNALGILSKWHMGLLNNVIQ